MIHEKQVFFLFGFDGLLGGVGNFWKADFEPD
jgi:hypothetical protein